MYSTTIRNKEPPKRRRLKIHECKDYIDIHKDCCFNSRSEHYFYVEQLRQKFCTCVRSFVTFHWNFLKYPPNWTHLCCTNNIDELKSEFSRTSRYGQTMLMCLVIFHGQYKMILSILQDLPDTRKDFGLVLRLCLAMTQMDTCVCRGRGVKSLSSRQRVLLVPNIPAASYTCIAQALRASAFLGMDSCTLDPKYIFDPHNGAVDYGLHRVLTPEWDVLLSSATLYDKAWKVGFGQYVLNTLETRGIFVPEEIVQVILEFWCPNVCLLGNHAREEYYEIVRAIVDGSPPWIDLSPWGITSLSTGYVECLGSQHVAFQGFVKHGV